MSVSAASGGVSAASAGASAGASVVASATSAGAGSMGGEEDGGVGAWLAFCGWLRGHERLWQRPNQAKSWAFGLFFPGAWRGKSNYSPLRAKLFRRLLGDEWYEKLYERDTRALWLLPDQFHEWTKNPTVRSAVGKNLEAVLRHHQLLEELSAVGWNKLLQAAYDFEFPDLFLTVWDKMAQRKLPWTPDQLALFHSIY